MKHHITKPLIVIAVALTSFVFIWMYVNDTLQKAKASADLVTVNFVPATATNNANQNYTTDIVIQAQPTKKISSVDMYVASTGSLQITDISNPVPLSTGDATFFTQLKKEGGVGLVHIASVASKPEVELPQAVKVRITYRGTAPGGKLLVDATRLEVAGNTSDGKFSIGTVGEFTSTIAGPTVTPGAVTPTPIVTPATVILGKTYYASGSIKNGPSGSTITMHGTGARPNYPYRLVAGKGTTVSPCSTEVTELTTTPINASATGVIANTTAVINKAPGAWQLCFRTTFNSQYEVTYPEIFSIAPVSPTPNLWVQGNTWYSDGATSKIVTQGASITAYATNARANTRYLLVTGRASTAGVPCQVDTVAVNENSIYATAQGLIGHTTGVITRAPGTWQVCFIANPPGNEAPIPSVTSPLSLTVSSITSPTPVPLPDLVVTGMQITYIQDNGFLCSAGLGIRVTVKNQGAGPVSGSFAVKTNNSESRTSGGLAAGISTSVWIPGYVASGANTALVDSANQITESNETNNLSSQVLPVPTQPAACLISPTPSQCALKAKGDANCNNVIDLIDFEIWRKEFMGELAAKSADFNSDSNIDLIDFEIWRKNRN